MGLNNKRHIGLIKGLSSSALGSPPVNTVAPVVSGNTWVGQTLTTTNGTWDGSPTSYIYQWQRDGVNISGATSNTYTLVLADAGTDVRCVVTAINGSGSASANSNALTINFSLVSSLYEWNLENAGIVGTTMTAPDTGSVGGLNLINPTASQLATFSSIDGKQSALSDGIDDILQEPTVSDFRGSDTSGVMHFVFRTPSSLASNNNILFSVSKSGATTDRFILLVSSGVIRLIVSSGGVNTIVDGATSLSPNTNYIISVWSDGALLKGYLGTTLQWNTAGAGGGIRWFGDIAGTTTGVELLSREIGGAFYAVSNEAYANYTPYVSDAAALADQLIIANYYGITV